MRGVRSLVLLLLVAAGLGAYIYFVESERDPAGTETRDPVFTVESDAIEHIEITTPAGDVSTVEKSDGEWRQVAPVAAAADSSAVQSVASTLASMEIVTVLDEAPADLAPYGLDSPQMSVSFRQADDPTEHRLNIGNTTPTGTDIYVQVEGSPRLLLVASYQKDALDRTAFDLRDKSVLAFVQDDVDLVSIERTAGPDIDLVRNAGDWKLTGPVEASADFGPVNTVISGVSQARMSTIVSEGADPTAADLRTYGLDQPRLQITLGSGSTRAMLALGAGNDEGAVYARDLSRPLIFTVPESLLTDLDKDPDDLRAKDILAFTTYSAVGLEITLDGTTTSFVKQTAEGEENAAEAWTRTAPDEGDVNQTAMTDLLNTLSALRAEGFTENVPASGEDMIIVARFGDLSPPTEERVTLRRTGTDVYALLPGNADAAIVPTADVDRAVTQLEALTGDP